MAQRWNNLLFTHWSVSADVLRTVVPPVLPLDLYENGAWISVTPFYLSHLRPRGMPAFPMVSEFPELNVRTYVTLDGKPGVFFFSLDAGSWLAVAAARTIYHLPYFRAAMTAREAPDGTIEYESRRTHVGAPSAELRARYKPSGPVYRSKPGTLEHWLTERYCLYAVDSSKRVYRAEIHHRPWALQPVHAELRLNSMITAAGIAGARAASQVEEFARRLDVVVWPPVCVVPPRNR
jgi:uncharacterized protein